MKIGDLVRIKGGSAQDVCIILSIDSQSAFILTESGPMRTEMCEVLMLKSELICTFPAEYLALVESVEEIEEE